MGWPGESLLSRLWETVEKSGVGILKPLQIRRVGKAENQVAVERMLLIAAAEKQVEKWTAQPKDKLLIAPYTEQRQEALAHIRTEPSFDGERFEIEVNAAQQIEYLRKEINIQKSVAQAETILQHDEAQAPEQAVDFDWFMRWRDYAGLMSSEDLQNMWGALLAGEVKSPGTYAYRTLDFLRNLSPEEARLVERLGALIVNGEMLFFGRGMTFKTKRVSIELPIHVMDLDLLEELGILAGSSTMGYSSNALPALHPDGKYAHLLACGGRGLVVLTDDPKKKYDGVSFYSLTKLGRNVMKLVTAIPDESYLLAVGDMLREDGFQVLIADVVEHTAGLKTFTNTVPLPEVVTSPDVGGACAA